MASGASGASGGNRTGVAILGFGEVGQIFAAEFAARPDLRIAVFDILFADPERGPAMRERAAALGVRAADSAAEAGDGAAVVVSAVTAADAAFCALDAAAWIAPGQLFLDINSVSPATKIAAGAAIEAAGADYLDAAVMAPVPGAGLAVPILLSGRTADEAAPRLTHLGLHVTPVADAIGRASATKLCRSIMVKGLEALMVDCAQASAAWGVGADVFASLERSYPGLDWANLSVVMPARIAQHGVRRAAEMREAAAMLAALGADDALIRAVADQHERNARPKAGGHAPS